MIREGDIGEKLFPDFPDMKVDFSEIGIGKIGLAPPPPPPKFGPSSKFFTFGNVYSHIVKLLCDPLQSLPQSEKVGKSFKYFSLGKNVNFVTEAQFFSPHNSAINFKKLI